MGVVLAVIIIVAIFICLFLKCCKRKRLQKQAHMIKDTPKMSEDVPKVGVCSPTSKGDTEPQSVLSQEVACKCLVYLTINSLLVKHVCCLRIKLALCY